MQGIGEKKALISLKLQATMAGLLCLQLLAALQKTRKLYGILPFVQLMLLVAVHLQALWLVNLLNHQPLEAFVLIK